LGLLDPQVQRVQQLAELLPVRARVIRSEFWRARISAPLALGLRLRSDARRREGVFNATLACFADALRRGDGRGRMFFQPISDAGGVACRYECPG